MPPSDAADRLCHPVDTFYDYSHGPQTLCDISRIVTSKPQNMENLLHCFQSRCDTDRDVTLGGLTRKIGYCNGMRKAHVCEEKAALSLLEVQHGSEPDPQQLCFLGHVTFCNCGKRLHQTSRSSHPYHLLISDACTSTCDRAIYSSRNREHCIIPRARK